MAIVQSIDSALERKIGSHGVPDKVLNAALARAEAALEALRARHADGGLPLLRLPGAHDDLMPIRQAGRRLAENATDVVFLGTGTPQPDPDRSGPGVDGGPGSTDGVRHRTCVRV